VGDPLSAQRFEAALEQQFLKIAMAIEHSYEHDLRPADSKHDPVRTYDELTIGGDSEGSKLRNDAAPSRIGRER